jgi:hypothetical protein
MPPSGQQLLKQDVRWPKQVHVSWLSPLKAVEVVQSLHLVPRYEEKDQGKVVGACEGAAVVGRMEGAVVGAIVGLSVGDFVGDVGARVGAVVGVQASP